MKQVDAIHFQSRVKRLNMISKSVRLLLVESNANKIKWIIKYNYPIS